MSIAARRMQRSGANEAPAPTVTSPTADAGSVAVGSASYTVPAGAIFVSPTGNDTSGTGTQANPYKTVQRGVNALGAGGTVVLRAGVYHEGGVGQAGISGIEIYDNNSTIQNYPGEAVWLDGSSQATAWTNEGATWTTPFTTSFDHSPTWTRGADDSAVAYYGFINPSYPCASWPEQVFVDGIQLQQVNALNLVTANTFYVAGSTTGGTGSDKYDFNPTKIHIGVNPSGHTIRVSDLQTCLTAWSGTSGVTVRGVGVRRYATSMPMMGCVKVSGSNALLENVHIEDIATSGANSTNPNNTFRKVTALRCGNRGLAAYRSDDLELDRVRAEYCNSEHFNYAPEAGGMKVGACRRVTIHNSIFSNNYAKALWFDVSVDQPVVYNCDFIDNEHYGIFYEISANGICANNLIKGSPNTGLIVNNTDNMRLWNNSVIDCGGNTQSGSVRALSVYQDNRRPFPAGAVFGRDTRQNDTYYTTVMTWVITQIEIYNTIVANPRSGTQGVFCIDDTERNSGNARLLADYNTSMDGNVFHWTTQPAYPYIFPPATLGGVNPATYQSHTAMVSATGLDTNGSQIVPTSPLDTSDRVTASNSVLHTKATGIPADIAALVGQPTGTKHAGCWR